MHRTVAVLAVTLALSLVPSAARAATLDAIAVPGAGATNGVAVQADGTAWVAALTGAGGTLARVAPDGTVTQTPLAGAPTSVALVGGSVWVSLAGRHEIAVVDPANPAAAATITLPGGNAHCGPIAIADGGNGKAYVSLPQTEAGVTCPTNVPSEIAVLDVASRSLLTYVAGKGTAYDLLVADGSLLVGDAAAVGGDTVRRFTLDPGNTLPPNGAYTIPAGSSAIGLATGPDGALVATQQGTGTVTRTALGAGNRPMDVIASNVPAPFGAATLGQALYVAASGTGSAPPGIVRLPLTGARSTIPVPAGAQPWDAASGGGLVWVTDLANGRVFRLSSLAPVAVTGDATAVTTSGATVAGTVDPGGNTTTVQVEYGPTTTYGTAVALPTVSGTGARAVTGALTGLAPGTTFHYRVVATSDEGTAQGADRTFTTAATSAQPPVTPTTTAPARQTARLTLSARVRGRRTTIRRLRVTRLLGGERITATCKGRGCPAKRRARTVRTTVRRAGSVTISRKLTARRLRAGATITLRISRAGYRTTRIVVTIRKGRQPKVTTRR